MPRPAIFLWILVFQALLTACSSLSPAPAPALTSTSQVFGPSDGAWKGKGVAEDGTEIGIEFVISGSAIRSVTYSYKSPDGVSCTSIAHDDIPLESRVLVRDEKFSGSLAPDLDIDGSLDSDTLASGHASITQIESARRRHCAVSLSVAWTASKQPAAQTIALPRGRPGWCGQDVNCGGLVLQLLIFGLVNGAILALNAIGVTVIYSTVRTLNLAHGDVFALTTALVTSSINMIGLNLDWSGPSRVLILFGVFIIAVGFGALLSVGVEEAAFRPFRGRSRLAPLIASLGISFILYQAALVWRTFQRSFIRGEHRSVPGLPEVPTDGIPSFLPHGNLLAGKVVLQFSDVFVGIAAALLVLVATYVLLRTRLGRSIRAVAQNEELAAMVGVNRDRAIRRAFALGGALAGAAAFVFALYYERPFGRAGAESGLMAFAAALLGGIGSPIGALSSGLLLGVAGSLSDYFLKAQWTPVLLLGLLTGLLVWRRGGFASEAAVDEAAMRDSVGLTAPARSRSAGRWLLAMLVMLAVLPIVTATLNWNGQVLLRGLSIFVLLTLGLNILLGVAGVLDLGYVTSFALGAYAAAVLTDRYGVLRGILLDFSIVLMFGAGIGALFGALKGWATTRLRGDYLAVATLALALIAQQLIVNGGSITGGPRGLSALPPPHVFGFVLRTPWTQYYLVFGLVLVAAFASARLIASRTGRAWLAASEDETAAVSVGVDSSRYRQWAFVLSSGVAGIAGALYAGTFSYIEPDIAAFHVSAMLLAMVILGGAGSVSGAILGTLLIYSYDKVIISHLAAWLAALWPHNVYIGMVPNIRGTNFFNFGIALYLTVLWRARKMVKSP